MIQIACNPVTAKLMGADSEIKLIVSEHLSYLVEGAEYSDAYTMGRWDGRSSFFQYNLGLFPAGFVPYVHKKLRSLGHEVSIIRGRLPAPLGPANPVVDDFEYDPRYDYQMAVVENLLRYGQMVAQLATGGGKSRVALLAVARIRRPTLFLTTRGILMYQMRDHFSVAGMQCGIMGDKEFSLRRGVNVAMVQTIISWLEDLTIEEFIDSHKRAQQNRDDKELIALEKRMKKKGGSSNKVILKAMQDLGRALAKKHISDRALMKLAEEKVAKQHLRRLKMIKILQIFEFIILEEAHEASGNSYFDILRHCKNAHYRLSLTATPFMKADTEANMRLMACSGPVGLRVTEKQLIDLGILATPRFKFVKLPPPPKLFRTTGWQRAYRLGISENHHRNTHIVYEAVRAVKHGLSVMVLVIRKDHGKALKEMLLAAGVRTRYIFGEHDNDTRLAAREALKAGEIDVLIGSTILDVGVDVPAVGMIILAGGGKAEVSLRQRIGRGLRAKKVGPNVAYIVDFADDLNKILKEHALTRRMIIESTTGFRENILAESDDFDFSSHHLSYHA